MQIPMVHVAFANPQRYVHHQQLMFCHDLSVLSPIHLFSATYCELKLAQNLSILFSEIFITCLVYGHVLDIFRGTENLELGDT